MANTDARTERAMNVETLLEELLLLPPEQQARFFTLAAARPALRRAQEQARRAPAQEAAPAETPRLIADAPPDYRIVFDGGSRGNPGEGYGSYQVTALRSGKSRTERLTFRNDMTNNEAEYETLISALRTMAERIEKAGKSPADYRLEILGDSQLVIFQVLGKWKAKDPRMAEYRDSARALLKKFGGYTLSHHDRSNSVAALGH